MPQDILTIYTISYCLFSVKNYASYFSIFFYLFVKLKRISVYGDLRTSDDPGYCSSYPFRDDQYLSLIASDLTQETYAFRLLIQLASSSILITSTFLSFTKFPRVRVSEAVPLSAISSKDSSVIPTSESRAASPILFR